MTNKEAIEILENYHNGYFGYKIDDIHEAHNLAIKALKERPCGKWIKETDEHLKGMYRCSVCGRRVEDLTDDVKIHIGWEDCTVADIYPFCHCGADMRKEEV